MPSISQPPFSIIPAGLASQGEAIRRIRQTVFIDEQGIPAELEWDEADATAYHVIALVKDHQPVGTGRLLHDGRIGRLAVLPAYRGHGIGSAMLQALIEIARQQQIFSIYLSARQSACGFYRRHGFEPRGAPFMEAGIPHQTMVYSPR